MRRVGKMSIGALEKREGEEDVLMRNDGVTTKRKAICFTSAHTHSQRVVVHFV